MREILEMKVKHKIPESSGLFPESAFTHRELSLLTFFERVLYSARQESTPLLERLRFLTICSAILDEFFEILTLVQTGKITPVPIILFGKF